MTRLTRTQSGSRRTPRLVTATAFVLAVLGVTAFLGGLEMLIRPMGSDVLPGTLLDELPVDSFLLPGILLASLFGIGATAVAYGLWRQPYLPSMRLVERVTGRHWAWTATQIVGWAFAGWMLLELALLGTPWTGAPIERATAWTVYVIYLVMAAWLIVSPWTSELRDELRILDLTALERTPEPTGLASRGTVIRYLGRPRRDEPAPARDRSTAPPPRSRSTRRRQATPVPARMTMTPRPTPGPTPEDVDETRPA